MSAKKYNQYLTHSEDEHIHAHGDDNQSNIDHHGHSHSHDSLIRDSSSKLLFWALIITFSFSLVEWLGGYFTHSIALQSDALHMLTDAISLFIAYIANRVSKRPANINLTFGYGKAEAVGALINCVFTLLLTCGLFVEVLVRFLEPVKVHGSGLFIIASISLVVNLLLVSMLSTHAHSLNTKAALIHALGDLLGSVVAIIAGAIIYFTDLWIFDPILSLIVIGLLAFSNYNLIKRSVKVLMAGVPEHLDYEAIGDDLKNIDGILSVHDLHIWYMSANKAALSAHVVAKNPLSWQITLSACQQMLLEKYQIEHVTIQHEFNQNANNWYCEIR